MHRRGRRRGAGSGACSAVPARPCPPVPSASDRSTRGPRGGQQGATLIEVLVVVIVLVPVILAAATGLSLTVRLSSDTKASQELDAAATNFAESIKEVPYVACAGVDDYDGAEGLWAPPPDSGIVVDVVGVEYWSQSERGYESSCPVGDEGAQLVTVRAAAAGDEAELSVSKRDPAAVPVGSP